MQPSLAQPCDIWPWAPHRCPRCLRCDTIPMPPGTLLDKLAGSFRYAPFKCRACRAKFYRRPWQAPDRTLPVPESASAGSMTACPMDPATTWQRLENIIRTEEDRHLRE